MTTYSQGVCEDGAAILKDGKWMTVDEIVAELQRGTDDRLVAAGLLAGYAFRIERAEPYLRNGTITKFISDLSRDMREMSAKMSSVLPTDFRKDANEWGNALNEAAWVFTESCPEKSALLFNNVKESLRAAILKYIDAVEESD